MTTDSVDEEFRERREAELEFVSSAYAPDEAWCDVKEDDVVTVYRRLTIESHPSIQVLLTLRLPKAYPMNQALEIADARMESTAAATASVQKAAMNAMPSLLTTCRQTINENVGEESIYLVFSAAEEWIQEELVPKLEQAEQNQQPSTSDDPTAFKTSNDTTTVLGRRLIYSHHIIAKKKRADIKALASDYKLTGYMKVGWPGLLIIEGSDEHCNQFYDAIRTWSWQYLVMRGEQQEVVPRGSSLDDMRKFSEFLEVEEMSTVAEHCREVALEALFRTSMKQYDNQSETNEAEMKNRLHDDSNYGALILVDHMNDGKGYRKWLRKCSREVGTFLFIKQFYASENYSNRSTILVGIVGSKDDVGTFLKRWRTSRVDVDSKGKACLERQMKVLVEGDLEAGGLDDSIDWDTASSEEKFTVTEEQMDGILRPFGWSLDLMR